MTEPLGEIESKLRMLRSLDADYTIFGSSTHNYKLNSVLTVQQIDFFENKYSVTLPPAYIHFLTNIGNGGAGPGYGLFPLEHMDSNFDVKIWDDECVHPDRQFRFNGSLNDTSMLSIGEPKESDYDNENEFEVAHNDWMDNNWEKLTMEYWLKHDLDGAIPLCHHGCAERSWLVVADCDEYGNVWVDKLADMGGICPEGDLDHNRKTFDQWYLRWLDSSLADMETKNA